MIKRRIILKSKKKERFTVLIVARPHDGHINLRGSYCFCIRFRPTVPRFPFSSASFSTRRLILNSLRLTVSFPHSPLFRHFSREFFHRFSLNAKTRALFQTLANEFSRQTDYHENNFYLIILNDLRIS